MQFRSHNHNVYLRKSERHKFVEKIGYQFPERIRRESKVLKILVKHPGIPQIISEDLCSTTPSLKLTYIEAKPFSCLQGKELNFAAKQVAIWLRQFADSRYYLPSQISEKYSVQQRDNQACQKIQTFAKKIDNPAISTRINRIQEYQQRKRTHCVHRDFRIDHIFVEGAKIWTIDWESASNGYMLQDAGNFVASILKQGRMQTSCVKTFAEKIIVGCSDAANQELIDWTVFSLLWGSYVQEKLNYSHEADRYLNLAKIFAVNKYL